MVIVFVQAWHNGSLREYCSEGPKFDPPLRQNHPTQKPPKPKRIRHLGNSLARI